MTCGRRGVFQMNLDVILGLAPMLAGFDRVNLTKKSGICCTGIRHEHL